MEPDADPALELIRAPVGRVTQSDLAGMDADAPLDLDSIERISLIAELENEFGLELDSDAVQPESFETLNSILALVRAHQA